MRARSSSLGSRCCAIAFVCSGVRRCFVRGTSFPSMRARNTSPALTWRSDAPRSIAALMICSMPRGCPTAALARALLALSSTSIRPPLVSGLQVDRVGEGGPCKIAPDVLDDEPRLALPEARRHGGDVGAHEHARVAPEGVVVREGLDREHIERRAAKARGIKEVKQTRLVQEGPARDVDDDGVRWEPFQHR